MKGTKIWYLDTNTGDKGIFNNATTASDKSGVGLKTLQMKLKEHKEYTWKGWIFARRIIEK